MPPPADRPGADPGPLGPSGLPVPPPWPQPPAAPRFGSDALCDLLPSVLAALDVPHGAPGEPRLELEPAQHVVVLLVDGLGWHNLRAARAHAPLLSRLQDGAAARRLDSGFPSTTPIALTSLGTGLPPGQHGIVGLFLRRPGASVLLDTLRPPAGTDLRALQPRTTAFEAAAAAGVAVASVGPRAFAGGGLTEIGLRGGRYVGADGFGERVAAVSGATASARAAGERSLVYAYVGDLDLTGHRHGWLSAAWRQELTHVDRLVEQLADALPPGTLLLVTADHGMVDVPPDGDAAGGARVDVAATPELAEGVDLVGGDLRGLHVYTRPGAVDDVHAAWCEALGSRAWVRTRDQAVAAGWFGPVHPDVLPVLGDLVVATREDVAVSDSRTMPAVVRALVGLHGSLTEAEQHVPLLSMRT